MLTLILIMAAELGVKHHTYDGTADADLRSSPGFQLNLGRTVYFWGSYEEPKLHIVGQRLHHGGDFTLWGYGVGARHQWRKVGVFGEFGLFDPEIDPIPKAELEVLNTVLLRDREHEVFHSGTYRLDPDYGGRLGGFIELAPYLIVTGSVRFLEVKQKMDARNSPEDRFEEGGNLDLGAFEIGVFWRF